MLHVCFCFGKGEGEGEGRRQEVRQKVEKGDSIWGDLTLNRVSLSRQEA